MRAVEEGNLTLVIGGLVLCDDDVEPCTVGRELFTQGTDGKVGRFFYYPKVESLSLYHQVVHIAGTFLQLVDVLSGEAWHNAVHQRSAYIVVAREPVLEPLIVPSKVIFPKLYVLHDACLQVMSIEENQLARHDDESLFGISVEGLETPVEQLRELARIAGGWGVAQFAGGVKVDARFGGV